MLVLAFAFLNVGRAHAAGPFTVGLSLVAEDFTSPVTLVAPPDHSGRLFVVDQIGLVHIISGGHVLETPFLDLRDSIVTLNPLYDERGLLGLAFHPDYSTNGRFFVYYSVPLRPGAPLGFDHTDRLAEFHVSMRDSNQTDMTSQRVLLQIDHPQDNHNGGTLAFGPDRDLYLSIGDGGGANDVGFGHTRIGNGQDINNLLGSILRLDVDHGRPYGIPSDNPFVGTDGADEIYSYGHRNPYRMSFDMGGDHCLFVGDAGQNLWEEIDIDRKGGNYGWNLKEGTHCFDPDHPYFSPRNCRDVGYRGEPLIDPIIEYQNAGYRPNGLGHVVVGGYVYRGKALPHFDGAYIFGDWSRDEEEPDGSLFIASGEDCGGHANAGLWRMTELRIANDADGRLGHFVLGFGQDADGEVYVLTKDRQGPIGSTGQVYKIVPPGREAVQTNESANDERFASDASPRIVASRSEPLRLEFTLAQTAPARLVIFDVRGRRVRELVSDPLTAGRHSIAWNGRDATGRSAAPGVYAYRLECGPTHTSGRVVLAGPRGTSTVMTP
jgi:hypothetical protein